ncbi:hypothetical protein FQA39_LY07453 [Lamprigera yunnana]|nr:hypothetical protein FQA39_LY07453 [Lamprigera yunnana]
MEKIISPYVPSEWQKSSLYNFNTQIEYDIPDDTVLYNLLLSVVKELYHDTGSGKVQSILNKNLDRRYAHRVKYGYAVSFSPNPKYANQESSRNNGTSRAMIVADVLVHQSENVSSSVILPSQGYDTTIGNCGQVYVKYYDDEFYPKFVVYYNSRAMPYRGYRRYNRF